LEDPFEAIKGTLPITKVLEFYGVEAKRGNKALCPLHNDKTPSFTVYPEQNSWHCFGCKSGGTVIDFVMAYCGLDALEAAKKLDADFSLGIFGYEPSQGGLKKLPEARKQGQAYKGLANAFEAYMNQAFIILCDYYHLLMDWKAALSPKTPDELDSVSPFFVEACHQTDYIGFLIDCLQCADYDGQIQFYKTHRKEVEAIAANVKRHGSGRKADMPA